VETADAERLEGAEGGVVSAGGVPVA